MKRLLSIFLVSLLLYNMIGFSFLYCWEEYGTLYKQEINIEESGDYYWIKQPLQLPYQNNWTESRPIEGKVKHGENHYNLVEQRYQNDTLYTLCKLDDNARFRFMELAEHITDHVKEHSSQAPSGKSSFLLKNLLKEYTSIQRYTILYILEWTNPFNRSCHHYQLSEGYINNSSPPPAIVC
ncbi:hypothetical protein [Flectobacillus longus]|uniref:hypothetical protein n=1 Tax=Flectobacillus longus TaxID=2984207 RepID=UPI0024B838C7|nr:hypothetical protein [Flectobacillus longus]MDI9877955.1 hypothetical protein [Flectobacillus longus]